MGWGSESRRRLALPPVVHLALLFVLLGFGCSNDPYPARDADKRILYSAFREAPRTLDPARAYTTGAHAITGAVYDTLLTYHFLKRPLELIPSLAIGLPEKESFDDGRMLYRFELRRDLLFAEDDCFELGELGGRTREVVAADIAFQLARIADPAVGSPVVEPFAHIEGFEAFGEALMQRREEDADFAARPAHEQYEALGGIPGVRTPERHMLEIVLDRPYPQIRYWFAMEFTTPVPWEAVEWYDGREGRPRFDDHPVGTGPFVLAEYDKQSRYVLERSENWYGVRHPEWRAPSATYPTEGDEEDRIAGRLDPRHLGRSLPFIDRVDVRREKEGIPRFNKFLQGYYDSAGVIKESFDKVVQEDGLSPEMVERGISLEKTVTPAVYYLGFNMSDPVVGASAGERGRKLRQAMSMVIDVEEYTRVFMNGRGVPAQSPIPPGIYGFESDYRNPYRQVDIERARVLMAEAGYPDGIDPATGEALRLTFDSYDTSTEGKNRTQFYTTAWAGLGIDVRIEATNYNQFQEKVRNGAYQLFTWGWVADYPDPENFLFLLWSEMARSNSGGPNTANFANEEFDELFLSMKARENGPERMAEIRRMREILERERPWIELFHPEDYALYHGWLHNVKPMGLSVPTYQYRDLDPGARAELRRDWNQPILWPAYALGVIALAILLPGIRTYLQERQ